MTGEAVRDRASSPVFGTRHCQLRQRREPPLRRSCERPATAGIGPFLPSMGIKPARKVSRGKLPSVLMEPTGENGPTLPDLDRAADRLSL
jgi:hypothetical protein